jgi:hypothetical protein
METINSATSIRAAKDAEARAVRNHRTHPGCSIGLDQEIGVEFRGFPLPTKKGRTNPSLTGPKTLLNETI